MKLVLISSINKRMKGSRPLGGRTWRMTAVDGFQAEQSLGWPGPARAIYSLPFQSLPPVSLLPATRIKNKLIKNQFLDYYSSYYYYLLFIFLLFALFVQSNLGPVTVPSSSHCLRQSLVWRRRSHSVFTDTVNSTMNSCM